MRMYHIILLNLNGIMGTLALFTAIYWNLPWVLLYTLLAYGSAYCSWLVLKHRFY